MLLTGRGVPHRRPSHVAPAPGLLPEGFAGRAEDNGGGGGGGS